MNGFNEFWRHGESGRPPRQSNVIAPLSRLIALQPKQRPFHFRLALALPGWGGLLLTDLLWIQLASRATTSCSISTYSFPIRGKCPSEKLERRFKKMLNELRKRFMKSKNLLVLAMTLASIGTGGKAPLGSRSIRGPQAWANCHRLRSSTTCRAHVGVAGPAHLTAALRAIPALNNSVPISPEAVPVHRTLSPAFLFVWVQMRPGNVALPGHNHRGHRTLFERTFSIAAAA